MEREIFIIMDYSGSFDECGKRFLQCYLADSVANAVRSGTLPAGSYSFRLWADDVTEYHPFDRFRPSGRSDIEALSEFLLGLKDGSLVFFLSDGNFSSDVEALPHLLKEKGISLVPFAVGADSDTLSLECISTSRKVYTADNLISTIRSKILESA